MYLKDFKQNNYMGHETFYPEEELIKVLEEVKDIHTSIKEASKNRPYHINVIDELHANENAHSRILNKLLSYPKGSEYPILQSFVRKLHNWDKEIVINTPSFSNELERIDCLIQEKNKYAIIIENKIHDAADQQNQLEKYLDKVRTHDIPNEHIWVVYLTRDGRKMPESYSLTEKAKKMVGNRYTPLNYRFDILPWLREDVLPSCMIKEEWLISAIKQYIDHLEGMFQERKDDEKYNNTMKEIINKQFKLENLTDKDVIISNVAGQSFVNGLVVSPTVFVELKGHKSANETVYIDTEQLRLSGIEKINDIRMNWEMRDTDYNTIDN